MYDVAVIGLGGVGSQVAFQLAKRGAHVVGFDPFGPPHDRGSSHGRTRLIRLAYFEHPGYVPLLRRAYQLWDDLAHRIESPLLHKVGLVYAGPPGSEILNGVQKSAAEHDLVIEKLSPAAAMDRFPGMVVPEDNQVIFEPTGGYLRVEECVEAALHCAQSLGAELRPYEAIESWSRDGQGYVIQTAEGTYSAERLVIAGGAWAARLLPRLATRLKVIRKTLHWFETRDKRYLESNGFPAFLIESKGRQYYGFPADSATGLKAAEHTGGELVTDANELDRTERPDDSASTRAFLKDWLPGVSDKQTEFSACMYTMSPDGHFFVDRLPGEEGVVFAAGLSGHGFKMASVLGEILTSLSLDGTSPLPIDFLRWER
jgi:sarcosine oxidase